MKVRWFLGLFVILGLAVVISLGQARADDDAEGEDMGIPFQHGVTGAWVDWCLLCHGPYGAGVLNPPGPLSGDFLMFPTRDCTSCHFVGGKEDPLLLPEGFNRCSGTGGCHPWPAGFDPLVPWADHHGPNGKGGDDDDDDDDHEKGKKKHDDDDDD